MTHPHATPGTAHPDLSRDPRSLSDLPAPLGAWPRTRATVAAVELIEEHEPSYLVGHSLRSYFFATRFAQQGGLVAGRDYDDELLFIGTVLHDLGLTEIGNGDQRFEVDGADLAADFVRGQGLGEAAAEIVWDAVALHTSPGIAGRKRPEIALAHFGIGADIFEFGATDLDDDVVASAHGRYPRDGLRERLAQDAAAQIYANPRKFVPFSFPGDAARHVHPELGLPGLAEVIAACSWRD